MRSPLHANGEPFRKMHRYAEHGSLGHLADFHLLHQGIQLGNHVWHLFRVAFLVSLLWREHVLEERSETNIRAMLHNAEDMVISHPKIWHDQRVYCPC